MDVQGPVSGTNVTESCTTTLEQTGYSQTYSGKPTFVLALTGTWDIVCNGSLSSNGPTQAFYGTTTVQIDPSTPTVSLFPTGWLPHASFSVGVNAGPSGATSVSCNEVNTADNSTSTETVTPTGSTSNLDYFGNATVPTPGNGVFNVDCTATSGAGVQSSDATGTIDVDTQTPSVTYSGVVASPSWSGPNTTVTVTGAEPQALSGIASTSCSLDGGAPSTATGATQSIPVSEAGSHTLSCTATTGAGITSAAKLITFQVDTSTPALSLSGPDQNDWYNSAQTVTVSATPTGSAPIASITCTQGNVATTYPNISGQSEMTTVQVPTSNATLSCSATNAAGTQSAPQSWNLKYDTTAPTGGFLTADPSNPTLVRAQVSDGQSGVASAQIDLHGKPLQTSLDTSTGIASATIPDTTLADGQYQLSLTVTDAAGNSSESTSFLNGQPAVVNIPLRGTATLRLSAARTVRLGWRERRRVSGTLTAAGRPLPDVTITVDKTVKGFSVDKKVGTVTTTKTGHFSYQLTAPSSQYSFSYPGSATLLPASMTQKVIAAGHALLHVPTLTAGHSATITGQVQGGDIPRSGLLLQLYAQVSGSAWQPFGAVIHVHDIKHGTFSETVAIPAAAAGYAYRIRAKIPSQSDWPYATVTTAAVLRTVR